MNKTTSEDMDSYMSEDDSFRATAPTDEEDKRAVCDEKEEQADKPELVTKNEETEKQEGGANGLALIVEQQQQEINHLKVGLENKQHQIECLEVRLARLEARFLERPKHSSEPITKIASFFVGRFLSHQTPAGEQSTHSEGRDHVRKLVCVLGLDTAYLSGMLESYFSVVNQEKFLSQELQLGSCVVAIFVTVNDRVPYLERLISLFQHAATALGVDQVVCVRLQNSASTNDAKPLPRELLSLCCKVIKAPTRTSYDVSGVDKTARTELVDEQHLLRQLRQLQASIMPIPHSASTAVSVQRNQASYPQISWP